MNGELLHVIEDACLKENSLPKEVVAGHKFSRSHKSAMKKIFALYDENKRKLKGANECIMYQDVITENRLSIKKRLLIAAVVIIIAAILTGAIIGFISQDFRGAVYNDNTALSVINTEDCLKTIEYKYYLSNLSTDFELIESDSTVFSEYSFYENEITGQTIAFSQWVKSEYLSHLNTENCPIEEVDINGHTGLCIDHSDSKHHFLILVWDNGDYVLQIEANLSKNEIVELAKNAKILKS